MEDYPESQQRTESERASDEYVVAIYPLGLIPGMIIRSQDIEKAKLAQESRDRDKNDKPPKPPQRPNIPIGQVALSEGF